MFAGTAVRDLVLEQLGDLGNLMNLQSDAHTDYNELEWAIEDQNENGMVRPYSSS
jgi:hypothetical protein